MNFTFYVDKSTLSQVYISKFMANKFGLDLNAGHKVYEVAIDLLGDLLLTDIDYRAAKKDVQHYLIKILKGVAEQK